MAYCRQQGLEVSQFGYWKKRLLPSPSREAAPGAVPSFIPVQLAAPRTTVAVVVNERLLVEVQPNELCSE